jgi:uncharacterized radical SAM superfamily Fe-S cluster-containing enzyme
MQVKAKTHDQIKELSFKLGITMTEFLSELIGELYPISMIYDGHVVVHYLPSYQGSYTMVQFLGQHKILTSGTFAVKVTSGDEDLLENSIIDSIKINKTETFNQVESKLSKIKLGVKD